MKTRDENGRFTSTKSNDESYGFYSKLLNKPFDSLEELKDAELAYHKANDEKEKLAEERKERAREVEDALKHVYDVRKASREKINKVREECAKELSEAEDEYNKLLEAFLKDYKTFHVSYSNNGIHEVVSISDLVDSFFKSFGF